MWITDSNRSRNFLGQNYRFQSPRIPDSTSKIRVTLPRVNKKQSRFSSVITTNVSITCKFVTLPTLKHPSTLFGTEVRGYSISRFGWDSILPGFYLFRNFEGKIEKKGITCRDSSVLNFILFFKKPEICKISDKLEPLKHTFCLLHVWKLYLCKSALFQNRSYKWNLQVKKMCICRYISCMCCYYIFIYFLIYYRGLLQSRKTWY